MAWHGIAGYGTVLFSAAVGPPKQRTCRATNSTSTPKSSWILLACLTRHTKTRGRGHRPQQRKLQWSKQIDKNQRKTATPRPAEFQSLGLGGARLISAGPENRHTADKTCKAQTIFLSRQQVALCWETVFPFDIPLSELFREENGFQLQGGFCVPATHWLPMTCQLQSRLNKILVAPKSSTNFASVWPCHTEDASDMIESFFYTQKLFKSNSNRCGGCKCGTFWLGASIETNYSTPCFAEIHYSTIAVHDCPS